MISWNTTSGASFPFYVKGKAGVVAFDPAEHISRGVEDYTGRVENGYLNYDDGSHILLQDAEHPDDQYDVEIVADDAFYQAVVKGIHAVQSWKQALTLNYVCSKRRRFSFTKPEYFSWSSSDENVAVVTTDRNGMAHIQLTGQPGDVKFTLKVENGDAPFEVTAGELTVLEGREPFLTVPYYSQERMTLTNADVDVMFSFNVTARNAASGTDKTVFTASVYERVITFDGNGVGKTYAGTLYESDIMTGEKDIAALQLYPCNNLRLRSISDATLTFRAPDGKPYNGAVIIRGGVYKNSVYCPEAQIRLASNQPAISGRTDIETMVRDGKLQLILDPTQFKTDPDSKTEFGGAQLGDRSSARDYSSTLTARNSRTPAMSLTIHRMLA